MIEMVTFLQRERRDLDMTLIYFTLLLNCSTTIGRICCKIQRSVRPNYEVEGGGWRVELKLESYGSDTTDFKREADFRLSSADFIDVQ